MEADFTTHKNIMNNINQFKKLCHFLKCNNIIFEQRNILINIVDALNDCSSAMIELIKRHKDLIIIEDDKYHPDLPKLF